MTQKYYTERLLPVYIQALKQLEELRPIPSQTTSKRTSCWILQEDGDPSHGKRKNGLAQALRDEANIQSFFHPAQSPDLSPIEACWNIVKQRIRKRWWNNDEEYKALIQEEWDKITMKEIRARISEMPGRCRRVRKSGGKPIKSKLW